MRKLMLTDLHIHRTYSPSGDGIGAIVCISITITFFTLSFNESHYWEKAHFGPSHLDLVGSAPLLKLMVLYSQGTEVEDMV